MKIEKDIPIPKLHKARGKNAYKDVGGHNRKYPFDEMEIGDSIFVEDQFANGLAGDAAHQYGRKHGVKFTGRSFREGVRIWRIK